MKRLLVIVSLLVAAPAALAQAIDEAWIIERVIGGKYEELRRVQAESDRGSPVAMYWWGSFLDACLYDKCDSAAAKQLWLRSARAGYSQAKIAVLLGADSPAEAEALLKEIGPPANLEEKLGYALLMSLLSIGPDRKITSAWEKTMAVIDELVADRRLAAIFAVGNMKGFGPYAKELRAMVEAGFSPAAEQYRRWLLVSERVDYVQLLERARAGELAAGVAACETAGISQGFTKLPPDLLAVCERAAQQGFAGILPALLRHHVESDNKPAAAHFAALCATHAPLKCASDLAEYHYRVSGKSPAWELWDVVAASGSMPASEMGKPPALLRQAFTIQARALLMERSCMLRRYDPAKEKFEDEPRCEWRRPIAIPAEYLSR